MMQIHTNPKRRRGRSTVNTTSLTTSGSFWRLLAAGLARFSSSARGEEPAIARKWLKATAYAVPKETAPEGEGYFSIVAGLDGKLYIGTHANAVNSWLVEFDPTAKQMKAVVDAHKAIGNDLKGFGSQAKIHTRNNVGASGKIYFGTKQGYPDTTRRSARTIPAATRWSTTPRPARRRSIRSRCRTTASTASRPTNRAASPTSRPAPTIARPRRELDLPDPRSEDRQVPRADRHRAHLRLHRRRLSRPGLSPDPRRRHRPLRSRNRQAGAAQADDRRPAADGRIAPGPDAEARPDQLGHLARRQDALLRCR